MKDNQNDVKKVSLIFYSEEEGKRVRVDKWGIEIGKKYTIGRSKKKVDISIQDITISRLQAEFIYYDQNKIMIKDFNSSNGTYINKEKIDPYKEVYFSIKDILSIGDEKNELVFEVSKEIKENKRIEEEKKNKREDFNEIKQNKKNEENKNYLNKNEENKNYLKKNEKKKKTVIQQKINIKKMTIKKIAKKNIIKNINMIKKIIKKIKKQYLIKRINIIKKIDLIDIKINIMQMININMIKMMIQINIKKNQREDLGQGRSQEIILTQNIKNTQNLEEIDIQKIKIKKK